MSEDWFVKLRERDKEVQEAIADATPALIEAGKRAVEAFNEFGMALQSLASQISLFRDSHEDFKRR